MNKLLMFPFAILFLLTLFALIYTGVSFSSSTEDISANFNGSYKIAATHQSYSGFSMNSLILILLAGLAVATIAGFNLFGSGLSTTAQKIIFNSVIFGGIWAILSVITGQLMFNDPVGIIFYFWMILTILYIIGITVQIDNSIVGDA